MSWLQIIACTWWSAGVWDCVVDVLAGDEVGVEVFSSVAVNGIRWRTTLGEYPDGTGGSSSSAWDSKPELPCKARDALCISLLRVQTDLVVVFTVNTTEYYDITRMGNHPYSLEVVFTVTGVLWCFGCRTLWALQISSTDNLSSCTRHTLEISPVCCLVGVPTESFTFVVWVRWENVRAAWVDFSTQGWSLRRLSGDLSVIWNVPFFEKNQEQIKINCTKYNRDKDK